MTYNELNTFNKYVYNVIDYELFAEGIKATAPHTMDGYILEKWIQFQKHPIQFIAGYNEKTFNYFYDKMISENYKG